MMAVVVDHEDALLLALHLETTMDPAEVFQSVCGDPEGDLHVLGDRERRERVERVMAPRHAEADLAEAALAAPGVEDRLEAADVEVARLPLRVGRRPVGHESLPDL